MKKILLLLASASLLFSCSEVAQEIDSTPASGVTFKSRITTRSDKGIFEQGDEISVAALQESGAIYENAASYTYNGSIFDSESPISYKNDKQKLSFVAAYPAIEDFGNEFTFELAVDQSSDEKQQKSDLLIASTEATSDVCPELKFDHALTSVWVKVLTYGGVIDLSEAKMTFKSKRGVEVDVLAESCVATGSVVEYTAFNPSELAYQIILPPQVVEEGAVFATFTLDGEEYSWETQSPIELKSGVRYSYNWNIKTNVVEPGGLIGWWDEEEIVDTEIPHDPMDEYTWNLVVGDNGETTGVWSDDLFGSIFNGINVVEKAVKIYEAEEIPGCYRIANVYDPYYASLLFGSSEAEELDFALIDYDVEHGHNCYTYFYVKEDGSVYFPYQTTGYYAGVDYGYAWFATLCPEVFNNVEEAQYGRYDNGVITFPMSSIYTILDVYCTGDEYLSGNNNGNMYILFPGAALPTYMESIEVEESGFKEGANQAYAIVDFNVSSNTSVVKYAVVESGPMNFYDTIFDVVNSEIDTHATSSFDDVFIPLPDYGDYTILAVTYDENWHLGEISESHNQISFTVNDPSEEINIATGEYNILTYFASQDGLPATTFTLLATDDPMVYHMTDIFGLANSGYYYECTLNPSSMEFSVVPVYPYGEVIPFLNGFAYFDEEQTRVMAYAGDGENSDEPWNISLVEVNEEWQLESFNSFGGIFVIDADSGESIGYMEAVQGDKSPVGITYGAAPDAGVNIATGEYSVPTYFSEQDSETIFTLSATSDPLVYHMTDIFGLGNSGYYYKCTLNPETMEFSVMPEIPAFEEAEGIPYSFLYGFEYFDEAQTQAVAYVGGGDDGDEPWNISLVEVDGEWQLDAFNSFGGILVFDVATGDTVGWLDLIDGYADITYLGNSSPAAAVASVPTSCGQMPKVKAIVNRKYSRVMLK